MKTVVCLLFLIFVITLNCSSQDSVTGVLHINQLPAEGVVLNKGWKFAVGDNPAYASLGYDDSKWKAVDPTKDIYDIPALWKNSIVWFRLKLEISNRVRQQPLSLIIDQRGASEVYINGRLNYQFGVVSAN